MPRVDARYVIEVSGRRWWAPVDALEQAFLDEEVLPRLRPLSPEAYLAGPIGILGTAARSSYLLLGEHVLWCVEWAPGLLVLRFSPDGSFAVAQLRSPVPGFGGRPSTPEEEAAYDPDAHDPRYALVFTAWDAAAEGTHEEEGFVRMGPAPLRRFRRAMAGAEELGRRLEAEIGDDRAAHRAVLDRCATHPLWRGEEP